ncbi:BC1872 family protein [Sporosarcina sp. FSL W7-1283]|uniref:BC1872 family protein n=1 Tax=Sporosarcina sp. FSL W7-1283 TaxID=2921560 RepID=UPI0030F94057
MSNKIINELVATKVMDWSHQTLMNNDEGLHYYASYWVDKDGTKQKPVNFFSPSTNLQDAWIVAEKLGIVLIPQTNGDKFNWYACDVESVSHRGDEIAIVPSNNSGIQTELAPRSICFAALESVGVKVDAYNTED